jgi:hypothetical protein
VTSEAAVATGWPWDEFADALLRRYVAEAVTAGADRARRPGWRGADAQRAPLRDGTSSEDVPNANDLAALTDVVDVARKDFWQALDQPGLLASLAWVCALDSHEIEVLALLAAVELEVGRQHLLALAQGVTGPSALTLGDIDRLFPGPGAGALALSPDARLVRSCLVDVESEGTWASRRVRLPGIVAWTFRGDASFDPGLDGPLQLVPGERGGDPTAVLAFVSGADRQSRLRRAQQLLGKGPIGVTACPHRETGWEALVREATLCCLAVVLEVGDHLPPDAQRWITRADHLGWCVSSESSIPLTEVPERPWIEEQLAPRLADASEVESVLGLEHGAGHRLDLEQLRLVAGAVAANPTQPGAAIRRLAAGHLELLCDRIVPVGSFDDLVLAPGQKDQVRSVVDRYRHRRTVYETWGFRATPSAGLVALFSGPPGTGKTLAAEVLASELSSDLYRLDLSQVVSKYIGETEKNLGHVLDAAENANVVLLLDEADSLLSRRSDVSDAHDRYANLEVAYLLQRLERHNGLVILATNLSKNIDPAFLRRIHIAVEFRMPDAPQRLAIWRLSFPPDCPVQGVNLEWLASRFELSGGSIRNVALGSAFAAAAAGTTIGVVHVVASLREELQKLGRLVREDELLSHPVPGTASGDGATG